MSRIEPDWTAPGNVRAFTTTRQGGFSTGDWESFNLGGHTLDDPATVELNRDRFRACLPSDPGWIEQVHGKRVVQRELLDTDSAPADAVVCTTPGLASTILTADCLPVLLCSRQGNEVAVAHAGWKGLASGVLQNTVEAMQSSPAELMAWLGPAISVAAFEIGDEVREAFLATLPWLSPSFTRRGKSLYADLYDIARRILLDAGVYQVSGGGFCTFTDRERFFSYRRDGRTGRMATTIWMET